MTTTTAVPASPDDLLTLSVAARVLGRSTALIETLMKEGSLATFMIRRGKLTTRALRRGDVEAYREAMNARMTISEAQSALGVRSLASVHALVKRGLLTQHPPLPHRGTGMTYDREEVRRLAAERVKPGARINEDGKAPYTRWKENDRAALLAVLDAWPVLDHRTDERVVQQSPQGGTIYPAKSMTGDGSSPLGLPPPWQNW